MATEVQVFGMILDEETKLPVVILRAVEGDETLPIQIGLSEAAAIAATLEKIELPRPMTHDLLMNVIEALGARLERVEVVDLREGTFYGLLHLRKSRGSVRVDVRPSDAIAMALRARAPIFVADDVFRKVEPRDVAEASRQQWMGVLHGLEEMAEKKDLVQ
jgi:bifunctional DNase/RNase